ncbi:hypothetical protein FIV42_21770 [Persicimonas caeni]|uniref:Peptidase S8/S53 domain-containing protein n=1 Tax=Persicimonas caeni TaxID=2292766 RepID=A0A4Y6PY86_PERCE|nr:S8 family serine peptidase [Persicimonas caeni]QDG53276.1 hypothetical protein FIV42_21770 [Persicimonas caeni]QED34498.1 S8 family serine peptidase [Persicimonas caeni]
MCTLGRRAVLLLTGATLIWTHQGLAQTSVGTPTTLPPSAERTATFDKPVGPNIDPMLALLERVSRRDVSEHSLFASRTSFDEQGVAVSLRFASPPSQAELDRLERLGVQIQRNPKGGACRLATICRAWSPWRALRALSGEQNIRRVEALWQPMLQSPLEVTSELVGARYAHFSPQFQADGASTTIALIDTGVDVLHPAFFRADGGLYAWIDTNQNGAFDPGVDAVDLDGDGEASFNEKLRVLDATTVVDFSASEFENDDGVLQPARDWLYADMNGDRVRNVGFDAGFNEETPAYGEAIFVADDANRDGVLSPDEKLVRLASSKIAKLVTEDGVYLRGQNLIEAGSARASTFFHGSGSAGILVGGQLGYHDRVGVAPRADLHVYGLGATLVDDSALPLAYLEAAVEDGADVILHEWTNAFTQPLDGSTNFEAAMGRAREASVVQVTPAGNLNLSGKHAQRSVDPGDSLVLDFLVDEGFEADGEVLPYNSIFGSIQWRGEHELSLTVVSPSAGRAELGTDVDAATIGSARIDVVRQRTTRGTSVVQFFLESTDVQTPLETGAWSFELAGATQSDTIYGRITDEYSNWRPGVVWKTPSPDTSTLAFPATADAALAVAAFAGRRATPMEGGAQVGELRDFSGRGPRIDGKQAIDISAPDDPFVPLGATNAVLEAGWGRSWFTPFGGTSGASPHVAASVALLRQQHPDWNAGQLEERLLVTAQTDGLQPSVDSLPDPGWGHGKLDLYRALFGEAPAANVAPEAVLEGVERGNYVKWDASQSRDPDGDRLEYRFDVDYDGIWETDWTTQATYRADGSPDIPLWARVEVRDVHGARRGATRQLEGSTGGGGSGAESTDAAAVPDAGDVADAGLENPSDSCCTAAPGSRLPAPIHLLVGLGLVVAWRRRARQTK